MSTRSPIAAAEHVERDQRRATLDLDLQERARRDLLQPPAGPHVSDHPSAQHQASPSRSGRRQRAQVARHRGQDGAAAEHEGAPAAAASRTWRSVTAPRRGGRRPRRPAAAAAQREAQLAALPVTVARVLVESSRTHASAPCERDLLRARRPHRAGGVGGRAPRASTGCAERPSAAARTADRGDRHARDGRDALRVAQDGAATRRGGRDGSARSAHDGREHGRVLDGGASDAPARGHRGTAGSSGATARDGGRHGHDRVRAWRTIWRRRGRRLVLPVEGCAAPRARALTVASKAPSAWRRGSGVRRYVGLLAGQVDAARGADHAVVHDLDRRRLLGLVGREDGVRRRRHLEHEQRLARQRHRAGLVAVDEERVLAVEHGHDPRGEHLRLRRLVGVRAEGLQHGVARGLHLAGGSVHLEVAVLPLDDEDPGLHLGVLQRDVGQRLDVETGRDLDDQRGHVGARQGSLDRGAHVAHGLRLQTGRGR